MDVNQFKEALIRQEDDFKVKVNDWIKDYLLEQANTVSSSVHLEAEDLPDIPYEHFVKIMEDKGFNLYRSTDLSFVVKWS